MRLSLVILVYLFHSLSFAADNPLEEPGDFYVYWASSLPPEIILNEGIQPRGENDNLQRLAANVNCLATHDLQGSALISATTDRTLAEGEAIAMSAENRGQDIYIYSLPFLDDWRPLARSLLTIYPNRWDVRQLANIHETRQTRILRGSVPGSHIYRVRQYRDGERISRDDNPGFNDRLPELEPSPNPLHPHDQTYLGEMPFSLARLGSLVIPACLAVAYCRNAGPKLFSAASMPNTCPNIEFESVPVKYYLARTRFPILFSDGLSLFSDKNDKDEL